MHNKTFIDGLQSAWRVAKICFLLICKVHPWPSHSFLVWCCCLNSCRLLLTSRNICLLSPGPVCSGLWLPGGGTCYQSLSNSVFKDLLNTRASPLAPSQHSFPWCFNEPLHFIDNRANSSNCSPVCLSFRWVPDSISDHAVSGGRALILHGACHRSEDASWQHRSVDRHQPIFGRSG